MWLIKEGMWVGTQVFVLSRCWLSIIPSFSFAYISSVSGFVEPTFLVGRAFL